MSRNRERVLIIGAAKQAREIIEESLNRKYRGYEIIGVLTFIPGKVGTMINGIKVFAFSEHLEKIVRDHQADSLVVTVRDRRGKLPVFELLKCKTKNIRVHEGFSFYEIVKQKIIIDEFLKPSWFLFEGGFFRSSLHKSVKRAQGLVVSLILLTILSPVLLIVALLIKLESPGPAFFVQERVGRYGKLFSLIKFRSMRQDAEKQSGPKFAVENDPRITRTGRIIRKIRLDEVPQFINIFRGDMDMVGPRPERPVFVDKLDTMIPHYYNLRHTVRPGLTGWAQVNYPYGESFEDSREKLKYDLYYVKYCSWYLDLLIMIMTVKEILFGRGQ